MEKVKKFTLDLKAVKIEESFDEFRTMDVSKAVGNLIHQRTDDIGIDDLARELYRNGKVDLSREEADQILPIIENARIAVYAKRPVVDLIKSGLKSLNK